MADEYTIIFDSNKSQLSSFSGLVNGLPMKFVLAELSHDYNRKTIPEYEPKIEELWIAKMKENPSIYNGSKFRLQDLTETSRSVRLKVGITCYRDFQCTNMQPSSCKILEEYGLGNYGDRYACLANPMFVEVLVESRDHCVVMLKRSTLVAESAAMVDFPGGHLEPSEVNKDESLENMSAQDVVNELYYSAVREVRDEINLPESSLSWPLLLGVIRNNTIGGKPGACFYIKCDHSSEEIKDYYEKGGPESFESTEVFLVKLQDLFAENSPKLKEFGDNLAVSAKAVLELYQPYYKP